jgi:hypothetical protein
VNDDVTEDGETIGPCRSSDMTTSQRQLLVMAGTLAALVFTALAVYHLTASGGHPRVKHTILFGGLAVASLLVSWFSLPPREESTS